MPDQFDDILRWSTLGGGEGDPAANPDDIQAFFEADLATLGTTHEGTDTLPIGATERANGTFYDLSDLVRYLDGGALVIRDQDGFFVPNPIVHIVRIFDDIYDRELYCVWIEDDS